MLDDDDAMQLIENWLTIEDRRERLAEAERIFAVIDRARHAMATVTQTLEEIGVSSAPLEPLPFWKSIEVGRFYGQHLRDVAEEETASRAEIAFAIKNLRISCQHPEVDCRCVAEVALAVLRATRRPCRTV